MAYCGYVTYLKNVRVHPNAERMLLADCFGNTVCVGLDAKENDVVLYFPVDGQLSAEYAEKYNLVRKKDENGNNIGGYLDPDKRNIKAISLRGAKSDGLVMPVSSLEYTGIDMNTLTVGTTIDVVNGHEICCKYIPKSRNRVSSGNTKTKTKKVKAPIAPLFEEHVDTAQLAYNLSAFKPGDEIEITLKMHGTSQRTGYLPKFVKMKRTIWDIITHKPGTPIYDWGYVTGTRRVVINDYDDGGYYGSNEFRCPHAKAFEGKLWKGETVYYEVVGFTHTGAPIMAEGNNEKLGKDFVKQYGKKTVFSYGCHPLEVDINPRYFEGHIEEGIVKEYHQSDIYVYRMTMTNEDGNVVEYTPDFMRYRCEQMGVKTVPVLWRGVVTGGIDHDGCFYSPGDEAKGIAENFYDGPDPIGKTHVREGVVVRILNRPKFCAYKHKNFSFKVIEGLIKDTAAAPDMEEVQEINE